MVNLDSRFRVIASVLWIMLAECHAERGAQDSRADGSTTHQSNVRSSDRLGAGYTRSLTGSLDSTARGVRESSRRLVRDQFNFYNMQQDRHQQRNQQPYNQPYNQPPYYQQPYNQQPYDDAEDLPYPPYQPYRRPYQPYMDPQPYQAPPSPQPATPTTPPSSSSTTAGPISPIGYMLIDTYHSPRGSYSRPVAYFTT